MKKSKKIRIGVGTGVIVAAVTGILLGIYIPPLLNKTKIEDLVKNQVIPADGHGNFMDYNLKTEIEAMPYNEKLQSMETFTKTALKDNDSYEKLLNNFIDNYIIQFWKGYKDSKAFTERYDGWIKSINSDWDAKVKDYKSRYGSNWTFYFQLEVLDPVGGNEIDWKRSQLRTKINADFDSYLWDQSYIHALGKDGKVITKYKDNQGVMNSDIERYLKSDELVNGKEGSGSRNNIVFQASENEIDNDKSKQAKAAFQEFVFNEWVRSELPLVTTMTLWKHTDPLQKVQGYYEYFNKPIADLIASGDMAVKTVDETDGGSTDGSSTTTGSAGISTGYKWQAFPSKVIPQDVGEGWTPNVTNKYLDFVQAVNDAGGLNKAFQTLGNTGAINIDTKYTDDSATLYYIELGDSSSSVIKTSFTQYATAATYKFNEMLTNNNALDPNMPTATALKDKPFIEAGPSGSEIMNNFLTTATGKNGYFYFPAAVQQIINDQNVGPFQFKGMYNGAKGIADIVDLTDTPFILARNEAGVHIIGIDRWSKLKEAVASKGAEGVYNEIANTVLWRHILTEAGINEKLKNGFSLNVQEKIKNFYNSNRSELLYKYIKTNEVTKKDDPSYVFSSVYTTMDPAKNILKDDGTPNSQLVPYFDAKQDLEKYKKNIGYNETVSQKIVDLQSSYVGKTLGNKVVENGIAGQLPFTRDVTADVIPDATNKGYVNKTYGMYESLKLYPDLDKTKSYTYQELGLKQQAFEQAADKVWTDLDTSSHVLKLKPLTFESAKYNQYVLLGTDNDTSTALYASDVELVSECLNGWMTGNTSKVKSMLDTQRMLSDVNGLNKEEDKGGATTKAAAPQKIFDPTNYAFEGTYSDVNTMVTAPTQPADGTDKNAVNKFVNYQLQKAYDERDLRSVSIDSKQYQGQTGIPLDQIKQTARTDAITPILKDPYDNSYLELVKDYIGLKAAFDYNEETGEFEFTKFRDYLVQQTSNNKKAAFVWVSNELNGAFKDYNTKSINDHFAYQPVNYNNSGWIDVNGYVFQGAPKRSEYVDADGTFKFGTFSSVSNYNNYVPVETGKQAYTGFQGMVFQSSSTGGDIPSDATQQLFGNKVYVYQIADDGTINTAVDPVNQGSMYSVGSRDKLAKLVESQINTWGVLQSTLQWLSGTFNCNIADVSQTDLDQAREQVVNIIKTDTANIPDSIFTRNKNVVLTAGPNDYVPAADKQFFGEADKVYSRITQVVFTQFNYEDVLNLFNTSPQDDGTPEVLDDKDKGINWAGLSNADHGGFLGTSAEAFFYCAMQWYASQSTAKSSAIKKADKRQGKVNVYDRRLNDAFGKDLVENYKKNN